MDRHWRRYCTELSIITACFLISLKIPKTSFRKRLESDDMCVTLSSDVCSGRAV